MVANITVFHRVWWVRPVDRMVWLVKRMWLTLMGQVLMARSVVLGQLVSQHLWRVRLLGWMLWAIRWIWLCHLFEPMVCVSTRNPMDLTIEDAKKFTRTWWFLPGKLLFSYENKFWVKFLRNIWRSIGSNKPELPKGVLPKCPLLIWCIQLKLETVTRI